MWGIQDYIYKQNGLDDHSLWCVGQPNFLDPEFDFYPANTNAWVRWGPIDLSTAVAARANFWYYNRSQNYSDYVRWGAYPSAAWEMNEGARHSGEVNDWMYGYVDFDSLEAGAVSLLGYSSVYVVWQFYSNYDNNVEVGAFIDEVNIAWDDGFYDLEAELAALASLDSTQIYEATIGEEIRFQFNWKAYGTGTTPDFDIACRLDGQPFYSERRNAVIGGQQQIWEVTYTDPWLVTEGDHIVEWLIDASREISESDEDNNEAELQFTSMEPNVPPWIHFLTPDFGDTTNTTFLITWEDEDPNDNAMISLYWDDDSTGYDANAIAGAYFIEEDDETDSFLWDLSGYADGTYWVWAYMSDAYTYIEEYSDGPLVLIHDWTGVHPAGLESKASSFAFESVYPNPFNSSTQIRFATPYSGQVSIRIYDSVGRLCARPYEGWLSAGYHDMSWSPADLPSGMYLIEIAGSAGSAKGKALYLK